MTQYIDKSDLVAEIKKLRDRTHELFGRSQFDTAYDNVLSILDLLEVKDPYEQCIQYASVKDGIEAHAETYSFNIESLLFNQLTKEQQKLWRKEIEQACISGGDAGYLLARDIRYKENVEVKEVDLNTAVERYVEQHKSEFQGYFDIRRIAKHFFELGLAASNKAQNIWHDASEKLPTGVIVVNNGGNLHIGWSTDDGDGIEDEHGNLITKTYQKWAREKDLT